MNPNTPPYSSTIPGTTVSYGGYLWRWVGPGRGYNGWEAVGSSPTGSVLGAATSSPQPQPQPSGQISSFSDLLRYYPGYAGWNPEAAFADFRATGGAGKGWSGGGGDGGGGWTPSYEPISEADRQALRQKLQEQIYPYYDKLLQQYLDELAKTKQRVQEDQATKEAEATRTTTENIARRGLTFSGIRGQELNRALNPIQMAAQRALADIATQEAMKKQASEIQKQQALETSFEGALARSQTASALRDQMQTANLQNLLRLYGIGV